MTCAELRDHAPGFPSPVRTEQKPGLRIRQHVDQDIAVSFRHRAEIGEQFGGRRVPRQYVPTATGDVRRLIELFHDAANGIRDRLAYERSPLRDTRQTPQM